MEQQICNLNCHECKQQETKTAKGLCATLLMPAMFKHVFDELQELKNLLNKNTSEIEIAEVKLPTKQKKVKNEYNEPNSPVVAGSDEG